MCLSRTNAEGGQIALLACVRKCVCVCVCVRERDVSIYGVCEREILIINLCVKEYMEMFVSEEAREEECVRVILRKRMRVCETDCQIVRSSVRHLCERIC